MSDRQLHLNLPALQSVAAQDFFVSESNRLAAQMIDAWPDWPGRMLALAGPTASGKSHLAAIWADRTGALVCLGEALRDPHAQGLLEAECILIDGADQIHSEESLLHLFNWVRERDGGLLLSARSRPGKWPYKLADLSSRLATLSVVEIGPPDDDLLGAVIGKQLADRQVGVSKAVIGFLVARMERSFEAAEAMVEQLDALSLAEKRPITVPLARQILEKSAD